MRSFRDEDCPVSGVPHSRQNLVAGRLAKPHCGQGGWIGAPQSPQNFVPPGLSEPQLAQRMLFLYPLGRFGARKVLAPEQLGNNLPLPARAWSHAIAPDVAS